MEALASTVDPLSALNPMDRSVMATANRRTVLVSAGTTDIREDVNKFILGASGSYLNGGADGAIDFAGAVSTTGTDLGPAVNPSYLTNGSPNDEDYQQLAGNSSPAPTRPREPSASSRTRSGFPAASTARRLAATLRS